MIIKYGKQKGRPPLVVVSFWTMKRFVDFNVGIMGEYEALNPRPDDRPKYYSP